MDILKVLSRGIKPTNKSKAQAAAAATPLPSAGALPQPQLFHDPVRGGSSRGKKRKRRGDAQEDDTVGQSDEEPSDVDYFAPKKPTTDLAPADAEPEAGPKKRKIKLLDEDECRQILSSHRLKFMVLSGLCHAEGKTQQRTLEQDEPASSKKKREKQQKDNKKTKKDDVQPEPERKTDNDDRKIQLFPQPLTSFASLRNTYDIAPQLAANIAAQGFREPTEVQMGSLPLLLRPATALKKAVASTPLANVEGGVEFLAVAPTGSGKTITFLIPAIDGVLRRRAEQGRARDEHVLEAVVVAPTRELASQIVSEGRKLAIGTGVRVVLMKRSLRLAAEEVKGGSSRAGEQHKDGSASEDESEDDDDEEGSEGEESEDGRRTGKGMTETENKPLARVDVLVTTPKTLLNFLSGGKSGARKALPTVRSLILDEADVLLDPVFRKQTTGIWRACTHPDLGLSCWSATMASNIEALITKQLEARRKRTAAALPRPLIRLVVGLKDTAVPNITHKLIYTATEQGKLLALRQLLHPVSSPDSGPPLRPPFLVFTQTVARAQALCDELQYDIPLPAAAATTTKQSRVAVLHASLSPRERAAVVARFRAGEVWVLVTTDVLARGVDFAGANGVVSYDVPTSAAAYVHRAGRTGRAGRRGGVAVTLYTRDDIPFVRSVANVIAASERQAGTAGASDGKDHDGAVQKWLLDALPKVAKEDKRRLKVRGVEARRSGGKAAAITTKSSWDRRREHNRQQAIEASKRRKRQRVEMERRGSGGDAAEESEWGGLED